LDPEILRQLKFVGVRPLAPEKEEELNSLIAEMGKIYGSTKVCPEHHESTNCSYSLEPELSNIMAESEDYAERTYYWKVIKLGNILEIFLMNHFIY
jgi:peptidyl-dipeptidase A